MEEPLVSVAVFQTQDVVANFTMELKSRLTWDAKSYRGKPLTASRHLMASRHLRVFQLIVISFSLLDMLLS